MESRAISDTAIKSSSQRSRGHGPIYSRLHTQTCCNHDGAWLASINDATPWLQVDFSKEMKITGIATQGRQNMDSWVKTYSLSYGNDGSNFVNFTESGSLKVSQKSHLRLLTLHSCSTLSTVQSKEKKKARDFDS